MAREKKKETLTPEERLQAALVPDWEQPYKVPENWCWVKVGTVSNIKGGKRLPKGKSLLNEKGNHPYIRVTDFDNESVCIETVKYIDDDTFSDIKNYTISSTDIYISIAGTIGKVGIIPKELEGANLTENAAKITNISGAYQFYLMFFLKSEFAQNQIRSSTISTTQPKLALFRIEEILLPLPPLPEQQRIVDRIESLFAKLDEAKKKTQDALDSFEIRKAAILNKAFTGELTSQWRKEHGVEMESWRSDLFKNIVITVKDKFDPTTETTSLRYIGLEHIQKNQGIIGFGTADDIKSLKTKFKTGDILYGKLRPYLNKHDIAQFDGICSTDILVYRTQYSQTAKYINYFMNTELFISTAVSNSKGINLPRVSEKEIGNIRVNIPPISEQTEIVRILDKVLAKEHQVKEAAETVVEQIDLIKKSILARAFRGELGTNDTTEESSIESLKRNFLETIEFEKVKPKQVNKRKAEVVFMHKTIMEALSKGVRLTPENLKSETHLPVDDFYEQLKELIDNGSVVENRENGESYLEAVNENRQTKG